jgi:hypothetical protein
MIITFMIYLHIKFHISGFSDLLLIIIKLEDNTDTERMLRYSFTFYKVYLSGELYESELVLPPRQNFALLPWWYY